MMKLKNDYVLREIAGEYIMIATGERTKEFNGMVRCNEVAYSILKLLQDGTTQKEIVEHLRNTYDVSIDKIEKDVDTIINQLIDGGFVIEL